MPDDHLLWNLGLGAAQFLLFEQSIENELAKQSNHIGLQGPGFWPLERQQRRKAWENWLDSFIDGGVGEKFWGSGTQGGYSWPADRSSIRNFVGIKVHNIGDQIKNQLKREKDLPLEQSLNASCPLLEKNTGDEHPPTPEATPITKQQSTLRKRLRRPRGRSPGASHVLPEGTPGDREQPSTSGPTVTPQNLPKRPRGRPRKHPKPAEQAPETAPPSKRPRRRSQKQSLETQDQSHLDPEISQPGAPVVIDIDSDDGLSGGSTKAPQLGPTNASQPPAARDFVLETSAESSEIKLIYGTDVPTLSHLVKKIHAKYGMGSELILGVKVVVGDRTFDVDLEDGRDWVYISTVVVENGARARMVVSTC